MKIRPMFESYMPSEVIGVFRRLATRLHTPRRRLVSDEKVILYDQKGHIGPVMTDLREEFGKILREQDLPDLADLTQIPKVGRNDPCPCGSGLKYKRCHGK